MTRRVLIVDDQFLIVQFLKIWVEACEMEVCGTAKSADEAVGKALELKPDIILMDVRLEGQRDGIDAANDIYSRFPCRIIYVTGSNESSTHDKIATNHPFRVLIKPVDTAELTDALQAA